MRYKLILVILMFFFVGIPNGFCDDGTFTDMAAIGCGQYGSNCTYFEGAIMSVPGTGSCSDNLQALATAQMAKAKYAGGNCNMILTAPNTKCDFSYNCICCDDAWVTAKAVKEDDRAFASSVTAVPIGSEKDAADLAFNTWSAATPYSDKTSEGYSRTDAFKGYSYSSSLDSGGTTSTVSVTGWKRAGFTKGPTYTLEALQGLPGGSGGGGISKADTQDAVTAGVGSALTTAGLTAVELKTKMDEAFATAHTNGYIGPGGGGGGYEGALTTSNFPGVKPSDIAGTYTGRTDGTGITPGSFSTLTNDQKTAFASQFTGAVTPAFNDFVTNMKTTALFGSINSFFNSSSMPSGTSPVDKDVITNTFGHQSFSFSQYVDALAILRAVVLIAFGYASFQIVMRGGGG